MADEQEPRRRRGAWEAVAFLEIAALCGFVIAQPVLGATGRSPDFFLFYGATTADVVTVILVFTLVPPVALWALGAAAGIAGARARRAAHVAVVGTLLVLLAIVVGKDLVASVRGLPLVAAALLAGVAGAGLYVKVPALGQFLRFAAVGPLVFALVFVFASPSGALVLPAGDAAAGVAPVVPPGGAAAAQAHPDVVTVMLDELPLAALLDSGGEIDAELYPNLAQFAGDAHAYTNATAVAGTTPLAAPAMLTGVHPSEKVAPHYSEYPDNLFALLGSAGYDMNVHESITLLCPAEHCPEQHRAEHGGLSAVLDESAGLLGQILSPEDSLSNPMEMYEEPTEEQTRRERLGAEFRFDQLGVNQPARFQSFMERLRPSPQPTLHFLHLVLPHAPWRFLPSGTRYEAGQLAAEGPAAGRTEWWLRMSRQRLQLQMSYTDQLVGGIIRTLKEQGTYDETAVVVTADHGVSLRAHTPARYLPPGADTDPAVLDAAAELLWVPMLVKEPGQREGTADDRNVLMTDLLPTLADLAGVEVPWKTDGVSVLGEPRAGTDKPFWDDDGNRRVVDAREGLPRVRQGLRGSEPVAPELVGRSLEEFTVTDGEAAAEVNGLDAFQRVYPERGSVPAFVSGTVPDSVPAGDIVIAVNDRIGAASTLTDAFEGKRWFAGLVADDGLFVDGPNRLSLLRVTGPGQLERLPLQAAPPPEE